jgi:hypothetical protein
MQNKDKNYLGLVLIHILLGVLIHSFPIISKIYGYSILLIGFFIIFKERNKNHEVLYVCAYIVGSEVFLRMTYGNPSHEFAKYSIFFFLLMGVFYSGFSKYSLPYWFFMILLIPGVIIANETVDLNVEFRKKIIFNLSGPVCLAMAAIYTYGKRISINELGNVLLMMGLPIISTATYVNVYAPNIKEFLTGTGSNEFLSGGFGPNQVATIFGLGMFIFFTRIILYSRTKIIFAINLLAAAYISYRGFLTFSRGGMMTGFGMIAVFLFFLYINTQYRGKVKLNYMLIIITVLMSITWMYTSIQTEGLIDKRYTNRNALGVEKKDILTGRGELAEDEITMFLDNPFFGIGVAKGTDIRTEKMGYVAASHDEITRMLAEHGSLGILGLMILFFTPTFYYLGNKQNIYLFCFIAFWFLTINHAAMRTSSPSFIYALSMLKVRFSDEEDIVHRK